MADWKEQYVAALKARDKVEKANLDLYNYCTKLANEKAELQKQNSTQPIAEQSPLSTSPPPPIVGRGLRRVVSPPARPDSPSVVQMRQDLAKAQHERGELQVRLDTALRELEALKKQARVDSKHLTKLTANVSQLTLKVRDREEELRGKAKLVEDVQDENVTLNLQLNMAEEKSNQLKKENQDLVDRWMIKMGKEAEQMNNEGKFG